MRVLIADDNEKIRSALRLVVGELCPDCCIEEAGDGSEALLLLGERAADILLFDWDLPGLDACQLTAGLAVCSPGCVAIAVGTSPESRAAAQRTGVCYFVGTNDPPTRLLSLLRGLLPTPGGEPPAPGAGLDGR